MPLAGLKKTYPLTSANPLAGLRKTAPISITPLIDLGVGGTAISTPAVIQKESQSEKLLAEMKKSLPIIETPVEKIIKKIPFIGKPITTALEFLRPKTREEQIQMAIPIGGMKIVGELSNLAKKQIAKLVKPQEIFTILKKEIPQLTDDAATKLSETLKGITKKSEVQPIVNKILSESKIAQPLAQEARKIAARGGTAEEFVKEITRIEKDMSDWASLRETSEKAIRELPKEDRVLAELIRKAEIKPGSAVIDWEGKLADFYIQATKGVKPKAPEEVVNKLIKLQESAVAPTSWQGRSRKEFEKYFSEVDKKYDISDLIPKVSAEGLVPKAISEEAIAKNIPEIAPKALPQLSDKIPQIGEELTSVQKITNALKEAKPIRGKQEALYTAERGARMAKALAVGEKAIGEAGFYAELGQLKGELPKAQFESIKNKISQGDIDNLFNQIKDSKLLDFWDTVSARGGLVKMFEGRVPTEGELSLLSRVFPKEFIDTILSKRSLWTKFKEAGYQLANIPRSVMASFDLSAPFRQGLFLVSHPKRFFGSFLDMFKAFGSENAFKSIQESIVKKPTFNLMKEGKLALTEMNAILTLREERFMSNWAEKIPLAGKVIRASGRAYTGFLNKLRADVFDNLIMKADKLGLAPRSNPQLVKEIANFVNVASGRGSLGSLQPAATALNSFFFSPRLMSSRLTLLNPAYYIKADPFVRKEALKSLFTVLGTGTSILGLAKLAGADVGVDPRSADFGKIIVGKTRIDIWGGFQQYIRMFGQLATGQYVSSVTGKLVTLGEGYKPLTRFDILTRQIEAKEAPIFSFITALLKGQNFMGEKISIPKEVGSRFVPMAISDIYEIYKNEPELLPFSGLGIFGFGLQTYSETQGKIPTEAEKKDTYEISKILGEQATEREALSNASNLMYKELKKLPKEEAREEFDRLIKENPEMAEKINDLIKDEQLGLTYTEQMIKQLGVENGERAKYIKSKLDKLSKEEKRNYYQNLIDKKIITKQVSEQLTKLLNP